MALSRRLETIIGLVPPGKTAADIGTDHGLVPAALAERGICSRVIATDLRSGPLEAARRLVTARGLAERIDLRLGDGLTPLVPGEADVLIIAGMGGALMQRILREGEAAARAAVRLILSPQSELEQFRRFLRDENYFIERERLVEEDGKYYYILSVHPGEAQTLAPEELAFGKSPSPEDREVFQQYLRKEREKTEHILKQLAGRPGEEERRRELSVRRDLIIQMQCHGSGKRGKQ